MSFLPSFPLIPLLRLSWLAATIPILIAFISKPIHQILTLLSSRGKTQASSRSSLSVPQSYFLHFYALALLLTTSLLISIFFYAHYTEAEEELVRVWRCVFLLALMEVQVVRRLYETAMVFDYSRSARMHVLGYCAGLFFYAAAPLSLANGCAQEALSYVGGQIAEFIVKGRENMPVVTFSWQYSLKPLINFGWCQWIGSAIFVWGWIHQLRCHAILGSLRKHKGADEYVIPHGDWFEYVSCPHYLAEIRFFKLRSHVLNVFFALHVDHICWYLGRQWRARHNNMASFLICGSKSCICSCRNPQMVSLQIRKLPKDEASCNSICLLKDTVY